MKIQYQKKKQEIIVTILFSDKTKLTLPLDSKTSISIFNKHQLHVNDILNMSKLFGSEFESYYKSVLVDPLQYSSDEIVEKMYEYASKYVDSLNFDYQKYSDKSKKSELSVFFNPEEVREVLIYIAVVKLLAFFIHSSKYESIQSDILFSLNKKFGKYVSKMYQSLKNRVRYLFSSKETLEFLKLSMTDEYILLYNFDFVVLTSAVFFDYSQDMNPISYLISLASDNLSFLVKTYSNKQIVYGESEIFEGLISEGDLLSNLSNYIVLRKIQKYIEEKLKQENKTIHMDLYPSSLADVIVIPLLNKVTGVSLKSLYEIDKLKLQWFVQHVLTSVEEFHNKYQTLKKFLLIGFSAKPTRNRYSKGLLYLLQKEFKLYGLESKILLLHYLKQTYDLEADTNKMYYIINYYKYKPTESEIRLLHREIIDFLIGILSEDPQILTPIKNYLFDVLEFDRITKTEFKEASIFNI